MVHFKWTIQPFFILLKCYYGSSDERKGSSALLTLPIPHTFILPIYCWLTLPYYPYKIKQRLFNLSGPQLTLLYWLFSYCILKLLNQPLYVPLQMFPLSGWLKIAGLSGSSPTLFSLTQTNSILQSTVVCMGTWEKLCMGTCQKDQKAPLHQGHGLPTLIFLSFINKRHKIKVELNILVNQSCLDSSSLTSEERSS